MADADLDHEFRHVARRRTQESILRGWREAGHAPYAHLTDVHGEGAGEVLNGFYTRECGVSTPVLANFLAKLDLVEIGRAIQSRARERGAA